MEKSGEFLQINHKLADRPLGGISITKKIKFPNMISLIRINFSFQGYPDDDS